MVLKVSTKLPRLDPLIPLSEARHAVADHFPALQAHIGERPSGTRGLTREQKRSRRKRVVRARTICVKRVSRRELERGRELFPDSGAERPRTRAECNDVPRPCPFVSCKHHLYLDVSQRTGSIKLNFPDLEVWEMKTSCALDIADEGGTTLENVGAILNVTRERVRQLELAALTRLSTIRDMKDLRDCVSDDSRA
jgi:hypothetical protein